MKTFTFTVTDPLGIHARVANRLVKAASSFVCDIQLSTAEKTANAKSILSIMSLAIPHGAKVTLSFNGEDEELAFTATKEFVVNNL